ncbi:MAG: Rpp14/Pop5 family protein [Candidatus Micrarchaeota archaeon]
MYATLKLKKRYIVFRLSTPKENSQTNGNQSVSKKDVEAGLFSFFLKFFGEYGYSELFYKLLQYDEKDKLGLMRCERGSLYKILGALALVENLNGKRARIIAIGVSGTIKTLKEKGFTFIKNPSFAN